MAFLILFQVGNTVFLVGAFSFKEKSPTTTVASFFLFCQTTELIAYVPLFTETDKTTQAKSGQETNKSKFLLKNFQVISPAPVSLLEALLES